MSAPSAPRLLGLTAVVVALAAAVMITGGPRGVAERPLLIPGLDPATVTLLRIHPRDRPEILIRLTGDRPEVLDPVDGPADEAVIRDLLSALVTARADRVTTDKREKWRAGLNSPRAVITLSRGPRDHIEIALGSIEPASAQIWLGIGERAYLVPSWIGDALNRDLPGLRRRRPFAAVTAITGVEIHRSFDLVLSGDPLRRRDEGHGVRISAAARARFQAALSAIVLDVLVRGDNRQPRLTIRVLGGATPAELNIYGPCPGATLTHLLVDGSAGIGCVRLAEIDELHRAAVALADSDGVLTAPLEGGVESVTAPAGRLARRGAGWTLTLGDTPADADDDAVAAFLDGLARPGTVAALPVGAPDESWTVVLDGGATEVWHWWWRGNGALFRRDTEPHAITLDPIATTAARTFGPPLRDRTVLTFEPTAVAAITATGSLPAALERGTLIGDWRVTRPAGATATPAATALVEALVQVRGLTWLPDLGPIRRTLTLTLDAAPVAGAKPSTHTIAIGAARAGATCAARIDTLPPIALDSPICAALLAPLTRLP